MAARGGAASGGRAVGCVRPGSAHAAFGVKHAHAAVLEETAGFGAQGACAASVCPRPGSIA